MNDKELLVALDVGTTKVCTLAGVQNKKYASQIEIIGVGTHPSYGLKKGCVINIEQTTNTIRQSLEDARLMAGIDIKNVTIGIAGSHIYSFNSSGVVAIKGHEISEKDIERVLEAARAIVIPSEREIIHVIPQEYRVDNTTGIKDPVGMCGVRLEVRVHIITGSISLIQNLIKCVEGAGLFAENITLQPIASSNAILSIEEKEMGTILVDIGGGTTDLAIWQNGSLIHTQIIPVGGNHFTNDLAVGLKISHAEAERIKVNHGCVLPEDINQSSHITVQQSNGSKSKEVQLSKIAEILGARAEELFSLINNMVQEKVDKDILAGGFVVTGGGGLINGISKLGEYMLDKPVKIGYPMSFGGMTNILKDPKYSTVLGLLVESMNNNLLNNNRDIENNNIMNKFGESLKNVFKEIF
jgi:cell division protein FtsA